MNWDSFFTDGDKPYSENLNDSLMLCDAFDVTVPAEMPTMFSNGEFGGVNVTRKCGVALVTLKSVDSGVTVGTDSISGTGSVVFRVYPNFNSFYKWSKIILEKTGTVSISFRKPDGTEISATVGSDGTISESSALKQLQEIDVVFTLTSATISTILIWFINKQGERTRTGALLEASQLVNVNGTVTANDGKAVSGDTVNTALNNGLSLKEDLSNKVSTLNTSTTNYPTCKAVKDKLDLKSDTGHTHTISNVTNLQSTLDNKASLTHTHSKADVTDLYKYEISSSEYNPTIDSTITIYVNVTDGNNEGVANHTFTMKTKNGDVSLTTDSNGQATHSYTCDTWGNQRFRVNGYSMYLNVTGWKTHTNNSDYTFSYNHELCELRIHIASTNIPVNREAFGGFVVPAGYRPATPVVSPIYVGNRAIVQVRDNGEVSRCSYTGSAMYNVGVYATLQWKY